MARTRKSLERRLDKERENLLRIEEKITNYTELEAPIHLLNQRDATEKRIAQVEEQLGAMQPVPKKQAEDRRPWLTPRKLRLLVLLVVAVLVVLVANVWLWREELGVTAILWPTPTTEAIPDVPTHTLTSHIPTRTPTPTSTRALTVATLTVPTVAPTPSSTPIPVTVSPTPTDTPVPPPPTPTHKTVPPTLPPTPTDTPVPPPPPPTHTPVPPTPTATLTPPTNTPTATSTPVNISNGDFEAMTVAPWKEYHAQPTVTGVSRGGQYGMQISVPGTYEAGSVYQDIDGLTPNQTVFLKAWVRGIDASITGARLRAHNTAFGNSHHQIYYVPRSEAWSELVLPYPVDSSGKLRAIIDVRGNAPIYVDDIQLSNGDSLVYPNSLINGNFEKGAGGWYLNGEVDLVDGYSSNYALCSVQEQKTGQNAWRGIRQWVQVTPGQVYDYKAWLKWENAGKLHMKVEWLDVNGNVLDEELAMRGTDGDSDGWEERGDRFTAPNGTTTARLTIWHGVNIGDDNTNVHGSTVWIDDVTFTPVLS